MTVKGEYDKDDIIKKIIELQEKEKELKRSKYLLQKQQPWYQQSQNIIGILAIIVTVIVTVFSILKSTDKLELTCTYSDAIPLTSFSPTLQEKISVTYKGIQTSNIGKINIKLKNTGTRGLRKDDFVDGPIDFTIQSGSKFGIDDSARIVPFLLDIVTVDNSKQRSDILKLKSNNKNANFSYLPSLLNKGDIVEFDVYVSDINHVKTSIEGSISNGKFISEKLTELKEKNTFLQLGAVIIDIFGAKWISIIVLLLVFTFSILKSIIIASDLIDTTFLEILFIVIFFLIDILFIVTLISIILN